MGDARRGHLQEPRLPQATETPCVRQHRQNDLALAEPRLPSLGHPHAQHQRRRLRQGHQEPLGQKVVLLLNCASSLGQKFGGALMLCIPLLLRSTFCDGKCDVFTQVPYLTIHGIIESSCSYVYNTSSLEMLYRSRYAGPICSSRPRHFASRNKSVSFVK